MKNLPKGPLPVWATDLALYSDPGEQWDSTSRKLYPGDGYPSSGFRPDERYAAQELNFHFNNLGKRIEWLEQFPVYNWETIDSITITHNSQGLLHSGGFNRLYSFGKTSGGNHQILSASEAGSRLDWLTETVTAAASGGLRCGDSKPGASPVLLVAGNVGAAGIVYKKTSVGGSWTATSPPTLGGDFFDLRYDSVGAVWVLAGRNLAVNGVIWRSVDDGSSWTTEHTEATVSQVRHVAINEADALYVASTNTDDVLTSTDKGDSWTLQTSALPDSPTAMAYSVEEDLFMAIGDGFCETSTDGVTWASRSMTNFPAAVGNSLVNIGGAWLTMIPFTPSVAGTGPEGHFAASFDNGDTWHPFFPLSNLHTAARGGSDIYRHLHKSRDGHRLYCVGTIASVPITRVSRSLRMQPD